MTANRESDRVYSPGAIFLHWAIAVLVVAQYFLAAWFHRLFDAENFARGAEIAGLHKSIGIAILILTVILLAMRIRRGFSPLPAHMAGWEVALARTVHVGFYLLLLLMPLTGWAFAAVPENATSFFGLFHLPMSPFPESGRELMHELHEILRYGLIALAVLHVAAAIKHQFLDRDEVVARMLPFLHRARPISEPEQR